MWWEDEEQNTDTLEKICVAGVLVGIVFLIVLHVIYYCVL